MIASSAPDGVTPPPEYLIAYCTAQEMLRSAKAWDPEARLVGNATAANIAAMCDFLIRSVEQSYPVIPLCGVEFVFWVCPNDCRGNVVWANRVAVCQMCGASSACNSQKGGDQ